jgi:hypothetical protein
MLILNVSCPNDIDEQTKLAANANAEAPTLVTRLLMILLHRIKIYPDPKHTGRAPTAGRPCHLADGYITSHRQDFGKHFLRGFCWHRIQIGD